MIDLDSNKALQYLLNKKQREIDYLTGKIPVRKSLVDSLGIAIKVILPVSSINSRLKTLKKLDELIKMATTVNDIDNLKL